MLEAPAYQSATVLEEKALFRFSLHWGVKFVKIAVFLSQTVFYTCFDIFYKQAHFQDVSVCQGTLFRGATAKKIIISEKYSQTKVRPELEFPTGIRNVTGITVPGNRNLNGFSKIRLQLIWTNIYT